MAAAANCAVRSIGVDATSANSWAAIAFGGAVGQTFAATDPVIRSITVWRTAIQDTNHAALQVYIMETDSTGRPDGVIREGPRVYVPYGDGIHPVRFDFVLDPPLVLPDRGTYAFSIASRPCGASVNIVASGVDPYPGGNLWASGRNTCVLRGHISSYPAADLAFEITFCEDLSTGIVVPRFAAEATYGQVRLSWTVSDAGAVVGFRVHRAERESGPFEELADLAQSNRGAGDYRVEDRAVAAGRTYRYWLEVVRSGSSEWEGPVVASLPPAITRVAWSRVSPNPSTGAVSFELELPRAGQAWVRVYDTAGREVATLHRGMLPAGMSPIPWEGRDSAGRPVAAGVYLLRADAGGEGTTTRLVRTR